MSKLKRNIIQFTYDIEEFSVEIKEEISVKEYTNFSSDKKLIGYIERQIEKIGEVINQIQKLDKKDPVVYIYAGKPLPKYQAKFGVNAKIQVNDKFIDVSEVSHYILNYREGLRDALKDVYITALKVDADTNMGLVSDIREQLQEINALKLNYIARQGSPLNQK